ncbi:g12385 [Coccomyxa viridis]|uniref:G12385 protein n=1 Tax=Coccomyxa viridis TaxID=1274662 RepID=A0ABP1GCT7_9CHLO
MQANLTSLCWSTSRPSVYFTARADGIIDAWDIPLHGTRKPSLSYQVAKAHLTSITGHASGRYVASGCMDGSVYVMSIGTTLTDPLPNEKSIILQVLEAETMREKNIEKAQKEAKVRARKEGAKSIYLQDVREATLLDDAQVEEDFAAALSNI